MRNITLTPDQIKNILEAFSDGKYDHIPCPRGCCWSTKPIEEYIPNFIDTNNHLFTFEIEDAQITEVNED